MSLSTQNPRCSRSSSTGTTRSSPYRRICTKTLAGKLEQGDRVLVAGATGGVGQLVTAKLLEKGFQVRALCRDSQKAKQLFGSGPEIVTGDCRDVSSIRPALNGINAVACCLGTTAFPSARWKGKNGPEQTDLVATTTLIKNTPRSVKRFGLVSSIGVERYGQLPFNILNLGGVLKFKRQSEELLMRSGLAFTILRPGRLTDGPYTSYDLNTLLKATSGSRKDIQLSAKDDQQGEASRIAVAEALIQAMMAASMEQQVFSLCSTEGEGPAQDASKWQALFDRCCRQQQAA
ncbi:hypothetical protein WJX84_007169 [Apatococcus fuscideae]|uniref:NAD(P)-binding domain-containing protein n=1 Tax=Apatococcus fuscideae TaxID=2026836 RepID=A0AAW1TFY8_9CHLO